MMFNKKVLAMVFASSLFMSAASAAVVETPAGNLEKTPEISVMLPGFARDNGFMEAGYRGYNRIAKEVNNRGYYVGAKPSSNIVPNTFNVVP